MQKQPPTWRYVITFIFFLLIIVLGLGIYYVSQNNPSTSSMGA